MPKAVIVMHHLPLDADRINYQMESTWGNLGHLSRSWLSAELVVETVNQAGCPEYRVELAHRHLIVRAAAGLPGDHRRQDSINCRVVVSVQANRRAGSIYLG